MVFLELPGTSIGDGAFGAPDDPYELFRSLGATAKLSFAILRLDDLQLEKDRALARAYLSAGLLESGHPAEARRVLANLPSESSIRPRLPESTAGPAATESFADFATLRMLGRFGEAEQAVNRIKARAGSDDWRSVEGSLRHLGYGLVEGGHHGRLQAWLPQVTESVRMAVWEKWTQHRVPCAAIASLLTTFSPEAQVEARVAAIARLAQCDGASARGMLDQFRRPTLRLQAATQLARSSKDRNLLLSEIAVFRSSPRDPMAGSAKLLADAAAVLFQLDALPETRALLQHMETLPPDRVGETTYDDLSMPGRALLFAQLGDIPSALRWWEKSRKLQNYSQETDAYELLQTLVARSSAPVEAFASPSFANNHPAAIRIELGLLQRQAAASPLSSGRRLQHSALLAAKVYDPVHRSRLNREIGLAYLRAHLPRAAILLSRRCLPQDRVYLLAAALRWTPQSPSVELIPLLDLDE